MKRLLVLTLTTILWASGAAAELRLEVDLSDRLLRAVVDGDVVREYAVSVGKDSYPTPEGQFKVRKVIFNPAWKPPDS